MVFLSTLSFVGLDVLWATGKGTSLLLGLLAVMLFFTNAVYQDGRGDRPYPRIIHRVLYATLLTTPIISAISFYGLYLRLEEYGWTVIRGWAFVVWLVLSIFSIGYVVGIVRKRDEWTEDLARVNTGMGLVVLALMLLLNSPIVDLRKISLNSQLGRLETGQVEIENFDFWFVRQSLGRPGYLFMEDKKKEIGDSDPVLLTRIEKPVRMGYGQKMLNPDQLWPEMIYRPEAFEVPNDLREKINIDHPAIGERIQPVLIGIDLDGDDADEYVLLFVVDRYVSSGIMYYQENGIWKHHVLDARPGYFTGNDWLDATRNGEMSLVPHRFDMLKIDGLLFRPIEFD